MRLVDWQQSFVETLTDPKQASRRFNGFVQPEHQVRIDIYRNNNLQALMGVLAARFPLCLRILGQKCFEQFCQAYALANPLTQANLNQYGSEFSHFICQRIMSLSQEYEAFIGFDYLGDLAQLEWCIHQAYYAENTRACPISEMAELTGEQQAQMRFVLSADISLLACQYQVMALWQDWHKEQKSHGNPVGNSQREPVHLQAKAEFIVVSRRQYHGIPQSVSDTYYRLLEDIKQGKSLGQLLAAEHDMTLLQDAIAANWVIGFTLDSETLPSRYHTRDKHDR